MVAHTLLPTTVAPAPFPQLTLGRVPMARWERKEETGLGSWMDELGMWVQDEKLAAGVLWPHQGGAKQ